VSCQAELDRLREEVVRLQAKVDELEAAAAARPEHQPVRRRGLGSLIPGGPAAHAG
jgi:hypothetical protein